MTAYACICILPLQVFMGDSSPSTIHGCT